MLDGLCRGQSWSSIARLRAYGGTEPASSRWLSSRKGSQQTPAPTGVLRLVNTRENKNRYLSRGLLLILNKNRHLLGLMVIQPLTFLT